MSGVGSSERRVTLVRHGRSALVHRGWVDAAGFRAWREAYEKAGIAADELPPPALEAWARQADVVVASEAARAAESARRLAPDREVRVSPLLRELDLESPHLGGWRLPLAAWALAVGARVWRRQRRGGYPSPAERARLEEAALWITTLAAQHPSVLVVTHASFRAELTPCLVRQGWELVPGRRTYRPWSAWQLRWASGPAGST